MAYWDKLGGGGNIEDRRGFSPIGLGGGGLGIVGIAAYLIISFLGGSSQDLNAVLQQLQQTGGVQQQTLQPEEFAGLDNYEKFASAVLGSNNATWKDVFAKSGKTYNEPRLVLFRNATQSGCGLASSQVGPHYCPADSTIYLDETFFDELKKFGSSGGDVAEAYVIAHEVGHHVQNQLGTMDEVQGISENSNEKSIQLELQADCFAGVWAHSVSALGIFEPGEIEEATSAAAAVGDDRIQETVQGRIDRESWTHGSSQDRVNWFNKGLSSGNPAQCNTFS